MRRTLRSLGEGGWKGFGEFRKDTSELCSEELHCRQPFDHHMTAGLFSSSRFCRIAGHRSIAFARHICHSEVITRMATKTAIISVADLKSEDLSVLREALSALPGVEGVEFSVERSVAVLEFDPSQSHIDDFLRAVLKAGFKVL